MAPEQSVRASGHLAHHRLGIPRRVGNEMLEGLLVRIRNGLFHPLHVSSIRLQEAPQILPGRGDRRSSPGHEETFETTRIGA